MLDFNTSHDIVHKASGGTSTCEYCQGKMDKKSCTTRAEELVAEQNERRNRMSTGYYTFNEKDKVVGAIDMETILGGEDVGDTQEIKVLPLGKWNTTKYGSVEITKKHIDEMVKNFSIRKGIPIDTDHDGGASNGWADKLTAKDDGLYATIKWNTQGKKYLNEKIYKYFSPEFSFSYTDPQTSKKYGATFLAGTLTNRPLFKNLPALTANEKAIENSLLTDENITVLLLHHDMDLNSLKTKSLEELKANDSEFNFVKENSDKLTADERFKFNMQTPADEEAKKAAEADKKKKEEEEEMKKKKEMEAKKGNEETVTLKASEVEALKAGAEAGIKAAEELRSMKAKETVKSYLASESNKAGFLPKAEDDLVKLTLSFNDEQKELFEKVVKQISTVEFGEKGASNSSLTKGSEFENLVDKLMADDKNLTYGQATTKAAEQNPDAYKAYEEGLKATVK